MSPPSFLRYDPRMRVPGSNSRALRGLRDLPCERASVELDTLMSNEAPDRPARGMDDRVIEDPETTSVSSFVVEARRRGLDPATLLDADFLLRGSD